MFALRFSDNCKKGASMPCPFTPAQIAEMEARAMEYAEAEITQRYPADQHKSREVQTEKYRLAHNRFRQMRYP